MGKPAISAENLGKLYFRDKKKDTHATIREALARFPERLRGVWRRIGQEPGQDQRFFWALREVSFEVEKGQVLGVIGPNGSGKSTLLKILARITKPSSGIAELHGSVGSLLEVGTGFHPELTGRENIYLSGIILGMAKTEIDRKFDEIVAFSGMEDFLDMPIKRYSSGMQVRLAFAVAAHFEPEILLLDEVLAVGDAEFHKRSFRKTEAIAKAGVTVVLVTHDMNAVERLCNSALLLDKGEIICAGQVETVLQQYEDSLVIDPEPKEHVLQGVEIIGLRLLSGSAESGTIGSDSDFAAELDFSVERNCAGSYLNLMIEDSSGRVLVDLRQDFSGPDPGFSVGTHTVRVVVRNLWLRSGLYNVRFRVNILDDEVLKWADSPSTVLHVVGGSQSLGVITPPADWVLDGRLQWPKALLDGPTR